MPSSSTDFLISVNNFLDEVAELFVLVEVTFFVEFLCLKHSLNCDLPLLLGNQYYLDYLITGGTQSYQTNLIGLVIMRVLPLIMW